MSKRQRPSSLAEDTIDAVKKAPLLRSLLRVSDSELLDLPDEVIVQHIIGANVYVFFGLMKTNKLVREALENIPDLYFYLFKYVFRNEACVLYDLRDCSTLFDDLSHNRHSFVEFFTFSRYEVYLKKTIDGEWRIFPDEVIDTRYTSLLQKRTRRYGSYYVCEKLLEDYNVYNACLHNDEFAARTCHLFAICYPFGYPHASFYMMSHYHIRMFALRIVGFLSRVAHMRDRVFYDGDDDSGGPGVTHEVDEPAKLIVKAFHLKIKDDIEQNVHVLTRPLTSHDNMRDSISLLGILPLDSDALINIDINYLMTYWKETILPALRVMPFIEDNEEEYSHTRDYLEPRVSKSEFFVILEAFAASLDKEVPIVREEDRLARYFDTITDGALKTRVSAIFNTEFVMGKHEKGSAYSKFRYMSDQAKLILEYARQNIDDIYRILFYKAVEKQKEHMKSDYYFYMKGAMLQTTYCSHCGQNDVSQEDDLFSLPFCGESCKDAAFSSYAELLYL